MINMATKNSSQPSAVTPPTDLIVQDSTDSSMAISWKHQFDQCDNKTINFSHFNIECSSKNADNEVVEYVHRQVVDKLMMLEPLYPDTTYHIQVIAVYQDSKGNQLFSDPCQPITRRTERTIRTAEAVRRQSQKSIQRCGIDVYNLLLKKDKDGRYFFGERNNLQTQVGNRRRRTVLVVGATGSGKTTLINAMANYIFGVEWEDNFRFKLISESTDRSQAYSQTEGVAIYDLYHVKGSRLDYSLTVVDTPGFCDTGGPEKDKEIFEEIGNYLSQDCGSTSSLEAVCLVVPSSEPRLTVTQKYILSSILSLFGKNIKDNVCLMLTFADDAMSSVVNAIQNSIPIVKDANTGLPLHYKFNNSAFFLENKDQNTNDFNKNIFNMALDQFKSFFDRLGRMETKSLAQTRKVLSQRKQLQDLIETIECKKQAILDLNRELEEKKRKLELNKDQMEANKGFEFELDVLVPEQTDISGTGQFTTNCQNCTMTCHFPCSQASDENKRLCSVMNKSTGECTICKCAWNVHYNQKYRYEMVTKKIKRTLEEIRKRYEDAQSESVANKRELDNMQKELDDHEKKLKILKKDTAPCIEFLEQNALQPHPISETEYFDLLITAAESEYRQDSQKMIATLRGFRQMAEIREELVWDQRSLHSLANLKT